jgi:electron transfer flavoprotein alpha subunit
MGREEDADSGTSLTSASIVIGGGRGVGSADGFSVLEALAECIDGAVGGSRVATNNGWIPHTKQVGLTGNRIAPKLYIACGISGAVQHLVGCKGAKKIMVINNDPQAPFFTKADYGVIGDLHEILPAITQELKKNQN